MPIGQVGTKERRHISLILSLWFTCVLRQKPWRKFFLSQFNDFGYFFFRSFKFAAYSIFTPVTWFVHVHNLSHLPFYHGGESCVWNAATLWSKRSAEREHSAFYAISQICKSAISLIYILYLPYKTRVYGKILMSRVLIWIIKPQFSLIKLNSYFQSANVRRRFVIIATVLRLFG